MTRNVLVTALLTSLVVGAVLADPPRVVPYQGLVHHLGSAFNGTGHFKLVLVDGTGESVWSNDGSSSGGSEPTASIQVQVTNGLFAVPLGDTAIAGMTEELPETAFADDGQLWVRPWFSHDGVTFEMLQPDVRLESVGYALASRLAGGVIFEGATTDDAETQLVAEEPSTDRVVVVPDASGTVLLSGADAGGDLTGTYPDPELAPSGVSAGQYTKVTVDDSGRVTTGDSLTSGDLPSHNHWGETWTGASGPGLTLQGSGGGLVVENSGTANRERAGSFYATGVTGETQGIWARNDSSNNNAYAGMFFSAGQSGATRAVFARNDSQSDNARAGDFWAEGENGTTYGLYVQNDSTTDLAVAGLFWSNAGTGKARTVYAINNGSGDGSRAGFFHSMPPSGATYGIVARVDSTTDGATAGFFRANGNSGATYAVHAQQDSADGLAGYFEGNVEVTGTVTKAAAVLQIDDPDDPAGHYLRHAAVSSSEMKTVYDGSVVLGSDGGAWVELPEWVESVNRDFRYQLTAVGASAPGLYVAEEIRDGRFRIAGGTPGLKVCWQVTGVRHDAYARQHPMVVREVKPQHELGTYLHPELYGKPVESRRGYIPEEVTEDPPKR